MGFDDGDNILPFERKLITPIELIGEYFRIRGLKPEIIKAAGIRVVGSMKEMFDLLGYNKAVWAAQKAGYTCGIAYPSTGDPESKVYRVRLLRPNAPDLFTPVRDQKEFKGKYLGVVHELNVLYQVPTSILKIKEPHDVMLVEGAFQVLRLAQDGIDAVGISGVYNFRVGDKRTVVIPKLIDRVQSKEMKRLIIALDSDQEHNPQSHVAINQLAIELLKHKKDHEIYVAYPPSAEDGSKQGWDDFLQREGRAKFDEHLRSNLHKWEDNEYMRKCIAWQRYILVESTGNFFDTHPEVFKEVPPATADRTMMREAQMIDPLSNRVQPITFNHKHYLNSPNSLTATLTDVVPSIREVHFKDEERNIWVVNTYRFDLLAEPTKGDVSWWYSILDNLTRDTPSAKDKIIKLAAWKIQNPGGFLPLAIGLIGDQGAGKSLFMKSLGVCIGSFSDSPVKLRDTDNTTWVGYLIREWAELDPDMTEETWKPIVRQTHQIERRLYVPPRTIKARTLHGVTNNHIKQLVSKGDRVMIFGGYGKRVPSEVGLKWKDLIGEVGSPGLGIPALMHHLLYEVDTTGVESMDNRTEILGDIIEASQSRQDDIIDEILFAMSDYPDLEVLPSGVMQTLIERTTYKGSWMSLRKTTTRITTPFRNEGVKINNIKIRFCVLKNHDFWKTCDDQKEYEKQYKLALPLINSQKF